MPTEIDDCRRVQVCAEIPCRHYRGRSDVNGPASEPEIADLECAQGAIKDRGAIQLAIVNGERSPSATLQLPTTESRSVDRDLSHIDVMRACSSGFFAHGEARYCESVRVPVERSTVAAIKYHDRLRRADGE